MVAELHFLARRFITLSNPHEPATPLTVRRLWLRMLVHRRRELRLYGNLLLTMFGLIEHAEAAVDDLIDVMGWTSLMVNGRSAARDWMRR